jgi:hypothetical protein
MSKETQTPRLPKVGEFVRGHGVLVEIQDVTPKPPPPEIDYIFESFSARIESRVNGKVLNTHGTLNDFYGRGTCVESAIADAKKIQARYGASDVEYVVVKITSRVRQRPQDRREYNFYDKQFVDFESLKWGCRRDLPDDVEEVVWSSKGN